MIRPRWPKGTPLGGRFMPKSLFRAFFEVEVIGDEAALEMLDDIHDNILDEREQSDAVFRVLERGYERQWVEWDGYMVKTGATREAWTNEHALGAIREVHGHQFRFGSSIRYNKYHAETLMRPMDQMADEIAEAMAEQMVPSDRETVAAFRTPGRRL